MAEVSDLASLATAIQAVSGTKSKTTQQTKVTPEAMTRFVNDILAGEGGIGQIGSAVKKSGLYNSTTQDLLVNDLVSRAAARGALLSAPTEQITDAEGAGILPLAATMAGSALVNSILKNGFAGTAGKIGSGISKLTGLASGAGAGASAAAPAIGASAAAPSSAVTLGTVPEVASLTTSTAGATAGATATSGVGSFLAGNAAQLGGGLVSGILQGKDALEPENLMLTAGLGLLTGGPAGLATALLGTAAGSYGGDIIEGVGDLGGDIVKGIGKLFKGIF